MKVNLKKIVQAFSCKHNYLPDEFIWNWKYVDSIEGFINKKYNSQFTPCRQYLVAEDHFSEQNTRTASDLKI